MRPEDLKHIGTRVYDAINAQDLAELENLFDPGIVRHAAGEVGIDDAKRAVANAFAAAPDLRFQVEDLVAEEDRVALRVSVHRDGEATAEPAASILEIFRIDDGRVAEIWGAGTG